MDNLNEPLVTVGIPFYNSEKYLSDAVKSTINQTYKNLEIILLDDGSTDLSLKIAKKLESQDNRITVISDGENFGLPKRLNQLSELAKGEFYARMDADDIMFPERIKTQVEYLQNNFDVDLLGTGLIAINNENDIIGLRQGAFSNKITLKKALKGSWTAHPSITGKSKWFKENNYDETLRRSQDFELWIRTVEKSNFVRLKEPLLFYREASTSSIKKYMQSTKYSLKTFWNNKNKTGLFFSIYQSILKIAKLFVYFLHFIFGATDNIIKKRSIKLPENEVANYIDILKRVIV